MPKFRHLVNLKQNNANLQAFIDKSLDDVLPKSRQHAKYLRDVYLTFCTLLKILHKYIKNCAKENGKVQKIMCSRHVGYIFHEGYEGIYMSCIGHHWKYLTLLK